MIWWFALNVNFVTFNSQYYQYETMNSNNENIPDLLSDFCTGKISDKNLVILNTWMERSGENKKQVRDFLKIYRSYRAYEAFDEIQADHAFAQILFRVGKIKRKRTIHLVRSIAAIAILLIGSAFVFYWFNKTDVKNLEPEIAEVIEPGSGKATLILGDGSFIGLEGMGDSIIQGLEGTVILKKEANLDYQNTSVNEEVLNTIRIPRGGEYSLTLSDGTKVWLNSESELTYPVKFLKGQRVVTLKGEAYFKVTEDIEHPFVVNSPKISLEVLGTSFNIKSYNNDNKVEATLIEGNVRLVNLVNKEEVVLSPGEQGVLTSTSTLFEVKQVDTWLYTSWKDGMFVFKNLALENIMKTLSRWYDVEVRFENPNLKNLHFSGDLERYEIINTHLDMISMTTNVEFKIIGNVVYVNDK